MKTTSFLEIVVGGKAAHFLFDFDMPIASAKEACFQCLTQLGNIEKEALARIEAEKAKEATDGIHTEDNLGAVTVD